MNKSINVKKTLLAVLMASALGVTGTLYANPTGGHADQSGYQCKHGQQGKHGMKHGSAEKRVERMAKYLTLSETQKQQVLALMTTHKATVKPLWEKKRTLRHSLHSLDVNAADYMAKLTNLAEQKASLARQMTLAKGQKRQKLSALLTSEQQGKMEQMHQRHMGKKMAR